MKSSESIKNLVPALLKAQRLMGGAKKGASNPYFKSRYADFGSVLEACKDLLNDAGVVILQPQRSLHEGQFYQNVVETILVHESGEWVSSETPIIVAKANDPQALGSAITYARRYGLQSLLTMPAEDDDGEGAMARGKRQGAADEEAEAAPVKQVLQAAKRASVAAQVQRPSEAQEASSQSGQVGGGTPETPPAERGQLNTMISNMSKVILAKKVKTLDELRAEMKTKFGTDKKEDLSDAKAGELYQYLRSII